MTEQTWRKSSYSGSENECLELSVGADQTYVRDSKNPGGGVLTFGERGWARFLAAIKRGEFGRTSC